MKDERSKTALAIAALAFFAQCLALVLPVIAQSGSMPENKQQAAVSVEPDSISAIIELLALDPTAGLPMSRFCFREALLGGVADSLAERLERYTGNPVIRDSFEVYANLIEYDSTFTTENLIARINTPGTSYGTVLLTAHYDAIGSRSGGWWDNWKVMAAPGANDNATGVAAVLEAVRLLRGIDLPFDIEIILFSAEELTRKGSMDYVGKCDAACSSEILGVINVDMIGCSQAGQGMTLWTDFYSVWIAEILTEAVAVLDPSFEIEIVNPAPWNSDHASFYTHEPDRIAAVSVLEPLDENGLFAYDYYHTESDLPEYVDIDQVCRTANIVIGALEGFSGKEAEISLRDTDIVILHGGVMDGSTLFGIEEELTARIFIRNTGGAVPPQGTSILLTVMLETKGEKEGIYYGYISVPQPLRHVSVDIPLDVGPAFAGGNRIWAKISVDGFDDSPLNNSANAFFAVEGGGEILIAHHFRPNPLESSFPESEFCVELAKQADLKIEIYTIEGISVGKGQIGYRLGIPLDAGYSCHECSDVFPEISKLVSGMYLYRIDCFDLEGRTEKYCGKFAVEN